MGGPHGRFTTVVPKLVRGVTQIKVAMIS